VILDTDTARAKSPTNVDNGVTLEDGVNLRNFS
jgi:hypothetical protein